MGSTVSIRRDEARESERGRERTEIEIEKHDNTALRRGQGISRDGQQTRSAQRRDFDSKEHTGGKLKIEKYG